MALPTGEKGPSDDSRGAPSRSRGGGRGRGQVSLRSLPGANRLAHPHPPSQHISSTRASACSTIVFGWTASVNHNGPHVRDAGARSATRARHTWGPKRTRHVWCATVGARAECARCACGRGGTHRNHVAPHHPCRKPMRNRGGVAIMVSGGPAHTRPYASTPAVPFKNHLTGITGWPRVIQILPRSAFCIVFLRGWWPCTQQATCWHPRRPCQKPIQSVRGAHEHDPRLGPKCILYCFFDRDGGGRPHRVGRACSQFGGRVCFVLFFTTDGGGGGPHCSWLAPGRLGEGVFINREQ